uniref:Ribophorin II n=1 Tax=Hyaloperonospora arabidopsidis (strain Emoy2) TaxID=559515 RepID=M4BAX9_HYAAE
MTISSRLLAACWAALLSLSLPVDAVDMKLVSSRVALTEGALEVAVVVTPKQPKLKQLTLETLVDTSGATVLSGLTLKGDGSKFVTKLAGDEKLKAGMYKLRVSAMDVDTKQSTHQVLQLKVTTSVNVASASVNGEKLQLGDKLTDQNYNAAADSSLTMEVKLQHTHDKSPIVAHQAFLRFTHALTATNAYFVLTADSAQTHRVTLQFATLSKKFGYNSGAYHVELILGSSAFEKAIVWDLGDVELQLGAAPPETPSPLYKKHLLYESDTTLKALPEIQHVMRQEDPRPSMAVSLLFTGAVLVPLVSFLLFVSRLGLNIERLFESSVVAFGCVFLASLGCILALFGCYWLKLTMFRTLGVLSVLGFVNFWSGHLTLKRLAEKRVRKSTKVG